MSSPVTEARMGVAEVCRQTIPAVPVFTSPPTNLSAPCIVLRPGAATQTGAGLWSLVVEVEVVGPAGDNEAATIALESMLWLLAPALSRKYATKVEWDRPSARTNVAQTYYTTTFDLTVDVS